MRHHSFFYIYVKFVCTCNRQQCTADIHIRNKIVLKRTWDTSAKQTRTQSWQYLHFDNLCSFKHVWLLGVFHYRWILITAVRLDAETEKCQKKKKILSQMSVDSTRQEIKKYATRAYTLSHDADLWLWFS